MSEEENVDLDTFDAEKEMMLSSTLVWKRYRAFESGVSNAMGLDAEQICTELGQHSCINKAHLTVLGGNEPFENGQYERAERPSALTPLAIDRVIISACSQRIAMDKAGNPQVFTYFPLGASSVNGEQVKQQATALYQRFLARDPSSEELGLLVEYSGKAGTAAQAAFSLCFAIGTHMENIFL